MQRIKQVSRPLNGYSRCFFGVWFLAMAASVGWKHADEPSYKAQIDEWHQHRVSSLKSETGWLNLAGLFWLTEGKNSLGRGSDFDLAFPAANASVDLGTLYLEKGEVRFAPNADKTVLVDGKAVTEPLVIFASNTKPTVLANGSLRWFIIKRGDKYGVRLRDLESPYLKEFQSIDRYPVDESWRVKARFEAPASPKTIPIIDVLGIVSQQPLAGTLVFERAGKTYRLDAVGEGEKLFILFGDNTNAHETYGSGRFLYADKPIAAGNGNSPSEKEWVTLDFNQAINPPCAFTPYATCPIPPKQNKLALAVTAGEKRYGDH
ncbi:DUF1684 domain-containing protein [Spirosoma radiotolerans]|uniref:DUF1684 domain-containing protein n=1 Tax=Spirosoma radiotolerans TaxID=1379870 RepID=A0A0E3ZY64_9BACT|nr:DUF1684 domain-containing protein [Spirosoma radiotolerans]AKD57269.1 hypothetical protein SD10_22620 [Spirosoma radiotolerans]